MPLPVPSATVLSPDGPCAPVGLSDDGVLVRFDDVTVVYGVQRALRSVSLSVRSGERVALIGPSGAGKSSLLGLLNATVGATSGTVLIAGVPVLDDDRWRREQGRYVATIPQQLHLTGALRVIHNVNAGRLAQWSVLRALWSLLSPREVDEAREVLRLVGLEHKIFARTDELSGGEQQRVAIARALRQSPRLLLADEPTASLDPARASEVMHLLGEVAAQAGCALIVSQHDVALALATCDRIVGLRSGVVQFDRPAAEVSADQVAALYLLSAAE
jgi:phosphonate transport system ATP-binding protein